MKTTGTIKKVLPVKTGTSKKGSTWAAQQFVLKTDDGDILLEVFGQKEIDEYRCSARTASPASSATSPNLLQSSLWHSPV